MSLMQKNGAFIRHVTVISLSHLTNRLIQTLSYADFEPWGKSKWQKEEKAEVEEETDFKSSTVGSFRKIVFKPRKKKYGTRYRKIGNVNLPV